MEKLKKYNPIEAESLIKALSNEVLRRVKKLRNLCCDPDENGKAKLAAAFGIKEAESYFN